LAIIKNKFRKNCAVYAKAKEATLEEFHALVAISCEYFTSDMGTNVLRFNDAFIEENIFRPDQRNRETKHDLVGLAAVVNARKARKPHVHKKKKKKAKKKPKKKFS
jgi:hypothetical protein